MNKYLVFKFGGSSFVNAESYNNIAAYLNGYVTKGYKICVVVSTMSGITGRLAQLLEAVDECPNVKDRDAVLTIGEILGASLLSAACTKIGISNSSLNAYQLGWESDENFTNSQLISWSSRELMAKLSHSSIVIVAGGQALTSKNEITMLGRNSSDLSAVVCAVTLGLDVVRIYSDVEGVFTADPFKIQGARLIPQLSYKRAEQFSKAGAKVLFHKCVEFARENNIEIECAHYSHTDNKTYIGSKVGASGDGAQVLMSDHLKTVSTDSETEFYYLKDYLEGRSIPYYSSLANGFHIAIEREYLSVLEGVKMPSFHEFDATVLTFDSNGQVGLYGCNQQESIGLAQSIHDSVVSGAPFLEITRKLEKSRSSYDSIFSDFKQKEVP